jgi:hypothetical protein
MLRAMSICDNGQSDQSSEGVDSTPEHDCVSMTTYIYVAIDMPT